MYSFIYSLTLIAEQGNVDLGNFIVYGYAQDDAGKTLQRTIDRLCANGCRPIKYVQADSWPHEDMPPHTLDDLDDLVASH